MARAAAGRGYERVTIAEVVQEAGVSRSTFYSEFKDKHECFYAAYDRVIGELIDRVAEAFQSAEPWPDAVREGLAAFLEALASEPELAWMTTVEAPGAAPEAQQRYRAAMERFLPFFALGRDYVKGRQELPERAEQMALGAAEAIVFDEVVAGRAEGLPRLLPDLLFAVLVPYLGPETAAEQMHEASAAAA